MGETGMEIHNPESTKRAYTENFKMGLWSALHLDRVTFPYVIALVGSGGKTSLMGQLAGEGKEHHLRVAVLTTTHIRKPPVYQEVFSHMEKGTVTIFGTESGEGKLAYPGDDCYENVCRHADLILIEADGSRGLPVKFPAAHEPVIPENVNMILAVCGMSGLERPGAEVCHRWELAVQELTAEQKPAVMQELTTESEQELTQEQSLEMQQAMITKEIMAELLEAGYGRALQQACPGAEFYYCLNQADTPKLQKAAAEILKHTGRRGLILSLPEDKNILYAEPEQSPPSSKDIGGNGEKGYYIAMIYMASGFGRRYGSNKLLENIEGKPLYYHGLSALQEAAGRLKGVGRPEMPEGQEVPERQTAPKRQEAPEGQTAIHGELVVVSQYKEILQTAQEMGAKAVYNPDSQEGITASIHHGIVAVPEADAYLFTVADQPWLKAESILRLMEEFCGSEESIACLTDGTRNGNPVIFSKKYKEELLSLTGDRGGSVILKNHPREVRKVPVEEKELRDIDTVLFE